MGMPLQEVLRNLVAPMVLADRGELFVGRLDTTTIVLHLRGSFSGCPGNTLAIRRVIEPALRLAAPEAQIFITSGELLPDGVVSWETHAGAYDEHGTDQST